MFERASCSQFRSFSAQLVCAPEKTASYVVYLTIIPRTRTVGSESIAYEAKGLMGYWLRGYEGDRNNCFSKIQLVGQKYRE